MARQKVTDNGDGTIDVGCGCRGRKNVTIPIEHLQRMAAENHDMTKAAEAVGVPHNVNPRPVMRAAITWALQNDHIEEPPKGWLPA